MTWFCQAHNLEASSWAKAQDVHLGGIETPDKQPDDPIIDNRLSQECDGRPPGHAGS